MVNNLNQTGFTLQELLIGMAVFIILSAIGVPSYINIARNSSRDNTTTDLFSDMYYARSEAIKRKTPVYLCRTADPAAVNPTCGGIAKDWSKGWLVFVDVGGTAENYDAGTDTLLKIGSPINSKIQVMANANADARIGYLTDGSLVTKYATAIFAVCDDRDNDGIYDTAFGQDVTVGAMGRPEITRIKDNPIPTCNP